MPRRVVLAAALLGIVACKDKQQPPRDAPPADAATVVEVAPSDAALDDAAVVRRPERSVYSLGDNLLTSHQQIDGELYVDAGSIGFSRYTRFDMPVRRWRYIQQAHGHRVALAARGGSIELPLTAEQAAAARAVVLELVTAAPPAPDPAADAGTARPKPLPKRSVKIGGRRAGAIELLPGRNAYTVEAAGRFVPGENVIVVEGGEVALASVRVIATSPPTPVRTASWDATARRLALAGGTGLAWYVHLPPDAHLVATVDDPACRVEVSARTDGGTRAGGLLGGGAGHVDLSQVGDQAVRLELSARDCPSATLADPVITVPGAPLADAPAGPPPKYVVFWVMDALRADRIRPFTPGARPEVPTFERLAATGAVFRQFYVGGNESQTSHATVWTGMYPAVHNVRLAGDGGNWRIPRALPVLGELVKQVGLTPIAVTGNGFVTEGGGYARGFAEFRNMMREKGVVNGVLYGADVVKAAVARLDARKAEPALLFLGTVDTHGPWIARKPWIDQYDSPKPYTGPFQTHGTMRELGIKRGEMGCSLVPPPRDIARLSAIYDSAVSYHDQQLGEMVAALQRMGIYDETMIVITADHGEELFEDGRCGHGGSLRETLVRVPLLVHYPPRVSPAAVEEGAEGVDILPTLLDALGGTIPDALQGESLLPRSAGRGRGWPRPSYASQFEYAHAMRVAHWKIKVGKRGMPVVLDLIADPDERSDISAARPAVRRMLTDALGLFLATRARWHKRTFGVATNLAPGAAALLEQTAP